MTFKLHRTYITAERYMYLINKNANVMPLLLSSHYLHKPGRAVLKWELATFLLTGRYYY